MNGRNYPKKSKTYRSLSSRRKFARDLKIHDSKLVKFQHNVSVPFKQILILMKALLYIWCHSFFSKMYVTKFDMESLNVQYSTTYRSPIYFLVVANVLLQLTREPLVLNNEFISELQYDSFSHLRIKFMYLTKSTYIVHTFIKVFLYLSSKLKIVTFYRSNC